MGGGVNASPFPKEGPLFDFYLSKPTKEFHYVRLNGWSELT